MKNCVVIFKNERTEFIDNGGIVTVTQIEDGEIVTAFNITPDLAEGIKKNLLEDEGAEEHPL